jgi:hypothetical protein
MSFLFGRARARTAADLPKQAREHVTKLEGPNGAAKVSHPYERSLSPPMLLNLVLRPKNSPVF